MRSITRWRDTFSWLLSLTKTTKSSVSGGVCSEEVFRNLACSESMRAEQSGHLCRILLVYHLNAHGQVLPLISGFAVTTISMLSRSCRDTDYIGWYRQDRILGVLLTALQPDFAKGGCEKLKDRLLTGLQDARTFPAGYSLQVRVLQQEELTAFNAYDNPAPFPGSKD